MIDFSIEEKHLIMSSKKELKTRLEQEVEKDKSLAKENSRLPLKQESRVTDSSRNERQKKTSKNIRQILSDEDIIKIQTKALEAAANAIVITNAEGEIIWTNPAFTELVGYTADEAIGQNPRILKSGEHDDAFYREMWETVKSGKVWKHELINKRKDGSLYPEEMTITPVMGKDDEPQNYIAIKHDISNRKQREKELKELNLSLEKTANRANLMAQDARQASKAKSEFLATMSHEIRTPMNGIIGMTNLLLDTELDSVQNNLANAVMISANSLLTLINDILDFSKIEAGRFELEPIAFDLYGAIETTCSLLSVKAREQKIELILDIEPGTPRFMNGDVGRIQQILANLLSNAIKFTRHGHVLVKVCAQEQTDSMANVVCTVEDSGIGVSADRIDSIFEIFTQADSSTTREFGGTGLGLTISKKLVDLMGGEIDAKSTPGEGSAFTFKVPLKLDTKMIFAEDIPKEKKLEPKTRILYAADANSLCKETVQKYLNAWNMQFDIVGCVAEAAHELEANNGAEAYHVLIIESSVHDYENKNLLYTIKDEQAENPPSVILLESTAADKIMTDTKHVSGIIRNPFHPSMLMDAIRRAETDFGKLPGDAEKQKTKVGKNEYSRKKFNAKILLVEDHPINQRVAVMELEKLGCLVDVAGNGRVAVDMYKKEPYDIIIMDINMPEMDGYEATKAIRKLEKTGDHITIIAMTANAMQGDKEKCIEAGMDDYISKPVHRKKLAETIARWVSEDLVKYENITENKSKDASIIQQATYGTTHFLLPVFDFDGVMSRYENDIELLEDIARDFIADSRERIEEIGETIAKGDSEDVREIGHALKGGAAYVGAERLREAAFRLEKAAKRNKTDLFSKLYATIKQEFMNYVNAVEEHKWK